MNRFNRSLLAAAVAGALCGGVGLVQAGSTSVTHSSQKLARFEHMHLALDHLREARKQMEDAEDIFHGHKGEAVEHVNNAIRHVEEGLKEQGEAAIPAELPAAVKLAPFEHVHHALDRLREARAELDNADKIFGGHREKAIEETDHAIHQLEEGIHDAEK